MPVHRPASLHSNAWPLYVLPGAAAAGRPRLRRASRRAVPCSSPSRWWGWGFGKIPRLSLERSAITCGPAGAIFAGQTASIASAYPLVEPARPVQTRAATTPAETPPSLSRKACRPPHDNPPELPVVL